MVSPIHQPTFSLKRKREDKDELSDESESDMKSVAFQTKRAKTNQIKEEKSTHLMGVFYKDIWSVFLQYLPPREVYATWRRINSFFKAFAPKAIIYFQMPYYEQIPLSLFTGSPLKFIRLSTPLFDDDMQNLAVLNQFPLTSLDLEEHPLQGDIEAGFVNTLKKSQIRNLHLYKCTFTKIFSAALKELHLGNLRLANCEDVDNATLDDLPVTLEKLDLSHCTQITSIASLVRLKNLRELSLGSCRGIHDFTPLQQLKRLEKLDLSNCEIQGNLQWIASVTSLQVLSLEQTRIEDNDLRYICQLPLLQALSLFYCERISNKGLLFLKELSLTVLNLTSCSGISDEGLIHLQDQVLLRKLSLRRTRVTEKGFQTLSKLVSLQILNLSSLPQAYMTVEILKNFTHIPLKKLSVGKALDEHLKENRSTLEPSLQPLVKKLVRDKDLLWTDRYLTFPRVDSANKTRKIPVRSYEDYWNLFASRDI